MRKPAADTKSGARRAPHAPNGVTLAERIVAAPYLVEPDAARARLSEWLAGLPGTQAKSLKGLLAAHPTVNTLLESLAESSPFLWDLVSRDPDRLLRLLGADPDRHLAALLAANGRAVAATADESEAMGLLRRMKAEAALLIALADIGGVWPVMRATRALTDLADTAVDAAVGFVLAEAARAGRLSPKDNVRPQDGSGYVVLAMGKMGAFELNYSSDIDLIVFYDAATPALPAGCRAGRAIRARDAAAGEAAAGAHRRRLRVPHRSAPAARSGLDRHRDLDRGGAVLLRERGAELGARRADQGARLRRRHRGRRGDSRRICRPSSGANISISPPSPTCTP